MLELGGRQVPIEAVALLAALFLSLAIGFASGLPDVLVLLFLVTTLVPLVSFFVFRKWTGKTLPAALFAASVSLNLTLLAPLFFAGVLLTDAFDLLSDVTSGKNLVVLEDNDAIVAAASLDGVPSSLEELTGKMKLLSAASTKSLNADFKSGHAAILGDYDRVISVNSSLALNAKPSKEQEADAELASKLLKAMRDAVQAFEEQDLQGVALSVLALSDLLEDERFAEPKATLDEVQAAALSGDLETAESLVGTLQGQLLVSAAPLLVSSISKQDALTVLKASKPQDRLVSLFAQKFSVPESMVQGFASNVIKSQDDVRLLMVGVLFKDLIANAQPAALVQGFGKGEISVYPESLTLQVAKWVAPLAFPEEK